MVYNGEIYNYRQIQKELIQQGHHFRTNSDTEVIVHAYEEYGVGCVEHFNGMFAFALWDEKKKQLMLARDRLGIKPLYYHFKNGDLSFASEIKALLAATETPREIDPQALHDYLTLAFIPHPRTMFKRIKKLPPAHILIWQDGNIKIQRYWDLEARIRERMTANSHVGMLTSEEKSKKRNSEADYLEQLRDILTDAVEIRLMSEVPLGVFLSGGIDSSTIVGIISEWLKLPVKTFSIGFEGKGAVSELEFARIVSDKFETERYEQIVKPQAAEILPELLWHLDEPMSDPTAIPLYYLCQMAKEHVTVALCGEGGDETFAGYTRYYWDKKAETYRHLPNPLRYIIYSFLESAVSKRLLPQELARRMQKFARNAGKSQEERYLDWHSIFSEHLKAEIYANGAGYELQDTGEIFTKYFSQADGWDVLTRGQFVDINTFLVDDLLLKTDKISMAHSLEARLPFLDHRLVEFALSMPPKMRLRGGKSKFLLKELASDFLPSEIINRKKQGFNVPIQGWLQNELKDVAFDLLLSPQFIQRGYFNEQGIKHLLAQLPNGDGDVARMVYSLMVFEIWCGLFDAYR